MIVIGPSDRRYHDHILLLSNHMHWIKRMLFYGQGCFFKMVSCQSQETGVANDTNWLRNGVITHRNLSSLITWRTDWQESSGDVHEVSKSLGAYSADRICVLTVSCLSYISIYVCRLVHLLWSLSRRWIVLLDSLTSFALRPWLNSESLSEQKKRSDREELPCDRTLYYYPHTEPDSKIITWSGMIRSLHLKFYLLRWLESFVRRSHRSIWYWCDALIMETIPWKKRRYKKMHLLHDQSRVFKFYFSRCFSLDSDRFGTCQESTIVCDWSRTQSILKVMFSCRLNRFFRRKGCDMLKQWTVSAVSMISCWFQVRSSMISHTEDLFNSSRYAHQWLIRSKN